MKRKTLTTVAFALLIIGGLALGNGAIAKPAPAETPGASDVEASDVALPDYVTSPVAELESSACSARFDYERNFWEGLKPAPDFSQDDSNDSIVDIDEKKREIAENRLEKLEKWEENGSCWKGLKLQ